LNTDPRAISPDRGNHAARIRDRSPRVSTRFPEKCHGLAHGMSARLRRLAACSAGPAAGPAACSCRVVRRRRSSPGCSRCVAGRLGAGSPSAIESAARQARYPPFCAADWLVTAPTCCAQIWAISASTVTAQATWGGVGWSTGYLSSGLSEAFIVCTWVGLRRASGCRRTVGASSFSFEPSYSPC
jgi:hypothetical protein